MAAVELAVLRAAAAALVAWPAAARAAWREAAGVVSAAAVAAENAAEAEVGFWDASGHEFRKLLRKLSPRSSCSSPNFIRPLKRRRRAASSQSSVRLSHF